MCCSTKQYTLFTQLPGSPVYCLHPILGDSNDAQIRDTRPCFIGIGKKGGEGEGDGDREEKDQGPTGKGLFLYYVSTGEGEAIRHLLTFI